MWIKRFCYDAKNYVRLIKFQSLWRARNQHNNTLPLTTFPMECVTVGKDTYGRLNVHHFGNSAEKLMIGNFCSIASNVNFVLGGEHDYRHFFNYPFETIYGKFEVYEAITKGQITVEDDVWIGLNSTIMSGVKIGKGAAVGANSLVTKNIPPYAIYYNGKVQKYRFSEDIIRVLMEIDFSAIDRSNYEKVKEAIYREVNHGTAEALRNELGKISHDS